MLGAVRCRAHQCPDDTPPDKLEAAFCSLHWDLLCQRIWDDGRSMAAWLTDAYGTPHWRFALEACVRALRAIEAEKAEPW